MRPRPRLPRSRWNGADCGHSWFTPTPPRGGNPPRRQAHDRLESSSRQSGPRLRARPECRAPLRRPNPRQPGIPWPKYGRPGKRIQGRPRGSGWKGFMFYRGRFILYRVLWGRLGSFARTEGAVTVTPRLPCPPRRGPGGAERRRRPPDGSAPDFAMLESA